MEAYARPLYDKNHGKIKNYFLVINIIKNLQFSHNPYRLMYCLMFLLLLKINMVVHLFQLVHHHIYIFNFNKVELKMGNLCNPRNVLIWFSFIIILK